jgi:uncharacterized membrane protein YecN with MAPEG domain
MPIPPIPATLLYIPLFALLILNLSMLVIRERLRHKVVFGEGGEEARRLRRAIRAQANAVEYVPISLLVLMGCELAGMSTLILHLWGGGLLIARISHAIGISRTEGTNHFRAAGALFQFSYLLVLPLWLLARLGGIA